MNRAEIRLAVRDLVYEDSANKFSDPFMNRHLDRSIQKFIQRVWQQLPTFFTATTDISYVAGQREYDLPTDLHRVVDVYRVDVDPNRHLRVVDIRDRDVYENLQLQVSTARWTTEWCYIYYAATPRFRIGIMPEPASSLTNNLRVLYQQRPAALADDSAEPPFNEEWHDYCVYYVARACMIRDRSRQMIGLFDNLMADELAQALDEIFGGHTDLDTPYITYVPP